MNACPKCGSKRYTYRDPGHVFTFSGVFGKGSGGEEVVLSEATKPLPKTCRCEDCDKRFRLCDARGEVGPQ